MNHLLWLWHVHAQGPEFKYLDYDTYSDFVVVAKSEEDARNTHPHDNESWDSPYDTTWIKSTDKHLLTVTCLGLCTNETLKQGHVVCASFHAG